jgi:hypothetical protein
MQLRIYHTSYERQAPPSPPILFHRNSPIANQLWRNTTVASLTLRKQTEFLCSHGSFLLPVQSPSEVASVTGILRQNELTFCKVNFERLSFAKAIRACGHVHAVFPGLGLVGRGVDLYHKLGLGPYVVAGGRRYVRAGSPIASEWI